MIALALALALQAPASAGPWTVPQLVDQALRVDPEVAAMRQDVRAAEGDRAQAGLYPNPVASVEDAIDWKYLLTESLELPPARRARLAVSDRQVVSAGIRFDQARLRLRGQVESLCYRLLAVRQRASLVEDNVRLLSRLRATLPARYQAGLKSTAETLRVDLEAAQTRDELSRVQAEEAAVRAQVNGYLLLPSSAPLQLEGELAPVFIDLDPAALLARALAGDPGLRLAQAGVQEQDARLGAARGGRWPVIDAGPALSTPRGESVLLGGFQAGLSLPIWDWKQGEVRAAKARRIGAQQSAESQKWQLESDLERIEQDYRSAKDRAQALTQQGLLDQSVKIRTQALLAYQQGLLNLTDTLDALRTSTLVQEDYIQSLLDGRQAIIELETHLGGPL